MEAIRCHEVVAGLADYLDGALVIERQRALEAHLVECARCFAYLVGYRETRRWVRAVAS